MRRTHAHPQPAGMDKPRERERIGRDDITPADDLFAVHRDPMRMPAGEIAPNKVASDLQREALTPRQEPPLTRDAIHQRPESIDVLFRNGHHPNSGAKHWSNPEADHRFAAAKECEFELPEEAIHPVKSKRPQPDALFLYRR